MVFLLSLLKKKKVRLNTCEQSDRKKWGQTLADSKEINIGRLGMSALEKVAFFLNEWLSSY